MKLPQGWERPFEDPIPLPDGRTLSTLRDAGDYITFRKPNSGRNIGKPQFIA